MTVTSTDNGSYSPRTIFVVALLSAVFAAAVIDIVIPITIVDISATFHVLPGTVSQLDSLIALSSVATGLLLAAFGSRLRYKSIVMTGILFVALCAVGFFFAPTFQATQLVAPLNGIGSVMIVVTSQTFIGNYYPLNKRAKVIGLIAAVGTLANAVGSPVVGFMTGIGGWRSVFIWFMLPVSLFSLVFMFLTFPRNPPKLPTIKNEPFLSGFRVVFSSKSAVACLVTAFLGNAFGFGGAVFEVTFLRKMFSLSPGLASIVGPLVSLSLIAAGAVIGGIVVNRVGRKRLTVIAMFVAGSLVLFSFFIHDLIVFLALRWAAAPLIGVMMAAATNLTLEQFPKFRGTTMSLSSAFSGVGTAVGVIVAGIVLNSFVNPESGFQALGLTVGALAFAGGLVILFFAKDPVRTNPKN
jgi:predicted MFS family arabinose efflux permease